MKMLVSGAAGFIGSSLVGYLIDDATHEVVGMDICPQKNSRPLPFQQLGDGGGSKAAPPVDLQLSATREIFRCTAGW
jgi:nucleoside-diphosphate-sugar epimerase